MIDQKRKQRLIQIAENAAELFITKGYMHTKMLDVARRIEISVGTLYLYVKSKKALLDFTLQLIFNDYSLPDDMELPLQEIEHDLLIKQITHTLLQKYNSNIKEIMKRSDNKFYEVGEMIKLIYSHFSQYRKGISILRGDGLSWPKLKDFYYEARGHYLKQINNYLADGIERGIIRPLKKVELSARLILESIAWFALHRHNDRDLKNIEDKQAMDTVIDAMTHAFYKGEK